MTTYTVVRFKPKPGLEQEFLDRYTSIKREFDGLRKAALAKISDGDYFAIAEWESEAHLAAARPTMAGNLATFQDTSNSSAPNRMSPRHFQAQRSTMCRLRKATSSPTGLNSAYSAPFSYVVNRRKNLSERGSVRPIISL
jgi:hypothetical protein